MKRPGPILVVKMFPELRRNLLELLASLSPKEWSRPTAAKLWSVKDVALHLLGGDLGILSRKRDGFSFPGKPIAKWEELVALINQLNRAWVEATQRLSVRVLCDLLAYTGPQVEAYFASLDSLSLGEPVDWAGSQPAPVWFDLAREYTERWHHQQQIRDATGRTPLYEPRLFGPVLDTFVRALPHTFRDTPAPEGTVVQLTVAGAAGGRWFLRRDPPAWSLLLDTEGKASAEVTLKAEDAWKIFTRGLSREEALRRAKLTGDRALAGKVLDAVCVIA